MTVKNFGIFILKDLIYIFINIQLKQTKTLPVVIKIRIRRHRQSSIKWVKIFQKKTNIILHHTLIYNPNTNIYIFPFLA